MTLNLTLARVKEASFPRLFTSIETPGEELEVRYLERNKPKCFDEQLPTTLDEEGLERLGNLAKREFYDPNVFLFLSCIITSLVSGKAKIANVKNWIKRSKRKVFKEDYIEILSSLGEVKRDLLLGSSPILNLTHETFIGLYGTNSLREDLPNFQYIYGGFRCASPVVFREKVYDFCWREEGEEGPYNYIVEERLYGTTMEKALKYSRGKEFLNWFLQALFSLQRANDENSYTHFSLDIFKVFIRPLSGSYKFGYHLPGRGNYYLTTHQLALITDFTTSSIVYRGELVQNLPSEIAQRVGEVNSFPLYDAYSLLRSSYLRALQLEQKELIEVSLLLAQYFTKENPALFLERVEYLPPLPGLTERKLEGFILYILERFFALIDFLSRDPQGVASCRERECAGVGEIRRNLGLEEIKYPETPYSYYVDYLTLPLEVVEFYRERIPVFLEELEKDSQELDREILHGKRGIEANIKLTKKLRDIQRQLIELREVAQALNDREALGELDDIVQRHSIVWGVLEERDREIAEVIKERGRVVVKNKPAKYARYKNLVDYLTI